MAVKITTLTLNPALDKSTEVSHLAPEKKLRCSALRLDAGGGGINVSKAIRRLGGQSVAVFPEAGYNGKILCKLLEQEGVETAVVSLEGETRENLSVLETNTNAQYRFTMPGLELSIEQARKCLEIIEKIGPDRKSVV